MTQEWLAEQLLKLAPGDRACLRDEQFSALFAPGRPDDDAMNRALMFAFRHDCTVAANQDVCFVKKPESEWRFQSREEKTAGELELMIRHEISGLEIILVEVRPVANSFGWDARVFDPDVGRAAVLQESVDLVVFVLRTKYKLKP